MTHPMEKAFQEWDAKDKAFQRELNIHVCRRWDELMTEGKHGHYETLLSVCRSAISFWRNRAETESQASADAIRDGVQAIKDRERLTREVELLQSCIDTRDRQAERSAITNKCISDKCYSPNICQQMGCAAAHDETKADAFKLLAENARLKNDLETYLNAFKHTHDATGNDSDTCKVCNLNFRDPIHKRVGE